MLDVKHFRESPETLRRLLGAKRYDPKDLERSFELDGRRRQLLASVEQRRAEKNALSKQVGKAAPADRERMIAETKELGQKMAEDEAQLAAVQLDFDKVVAKLPNPPREGVPPEPESVDVEGRTLDVVGQKPSFSFKPKDHIELGEHLGWLDVPRASRLSGSRFGYLQGGAVLLQYALLGYAGGKLAERGFRLTVPPVLVREQAMYCTGFFPADQNEIYKIEGEDLYLVGTSEVPLAALHMDETVAGERLPLRYAGYSSCFRREAGAAGKDTRGVFRVHQFDKLEMFSFCHPDRSWQEHDLLRTVEEEIMRGLELHYRVIDIAASTLGAPAARKFDIEAWFPSQERYRELTSCSNCTDFQARRLGARAKIDGKTQLLHTLNGTAVAIGRTLIALMENHQREDGSVRVPEVLRPFLPGHPEVLGPDQGLGR